MTDLKIKDVPGHIWNVDETGISLDHTPPRVLTHVLQKPHCITVGHSPTTTLIAAVSALGDTLPPYIIFKGERANEEMKDGTLPGTVFKSSTSGWSNSNIFLDFFVNHFSKHTAKRPLLLLYDGHSTHYTSEVIEAAGKEDIHLFVLPPHSSHALQPLDIAVFAPFKKFLSTYIHKFMHDNPTRVITIYELPKLICASLKTSMTPATIMTGFRKSGIFPFCPSFPSHLMAPPEVTKKTPVKSRTEDATRKIKMLLEGKLQEFSALTPTTKKRKTFVPPQGALVSSTEVLQQKRAAAEKKRPAENAEKERYVPIFKSSRNSQTAGPSGLQPAKEKDTPDQEEEVDDEENEVCIICKRFQPEELKRMPRLVIVNWASCDKCNGWVHLKFCCKETHVGRTDSFLCPLCKEGGRGLEE